jgi:hypothetical protein
MIEEKLKEGELIKEVYSGTTYHFIVKGGKRIKHREDGPAVENEREKEWFLWGKRHNENGPARISWAWTDDIVKKPIFDLNGERVWNEQWYFSDKIHRIDGPANIIRGGGGYEGWYENGILHKIDGPAEIVNGESRYWINGYQFHHIDYLKARIIYKIQIALQDFIHKICIGRCVSGKGDSMTTTGFKRGGYKKPRLLPPRPWSCY